MTEIDEQRAPSAERNWKKIGLIGGGVFLVLVVIGAFAGDPEEKQVAANEVTTTKAPTTTEAPTTTAPPPPPPTTAPPATVPPTTEGPFAGETVSQRNARQKEADYLDYSSFSRSGLIEQLVYEGFTQAQAEYGVGTTGL